jgi:hypothetical protein
MAHTLKLVGTAEWHDAWTEDAEETEAATVAMLSPEELRALIAAVVAENRPADLPDAA